MEKNTFLSTCLLKYFFEHTSNIFGFTQLIQSYWEPDFINYNWKDFIEMKSQPEMQLLNQWKCYHWGDLNFVVVPEAVGEVMVQKCN